MSVATTIRQKLENALSPVAVEIHDDSHKHAGHAGARPGGETHFRVHVVAAAFDGTTRVERQRRIYGILADEMAGPVHALQIRAETPEEAARAKQRG